MATPVHPLLFARSKPEAEPYVEHSAEPDDDRLCIFSAEAAHAEAPLTSEPPLPDAEPLTSEPPLSDAAPLTSESDAALDSGTTRP
ncbi:hypothetical protein ACFYWX_08050 [Streptomyces sp. NPDC002888]|uniref:hypothetical protein n=1 Tax=Streptomyces sp. NPDC002888 TaxID=3364668 RepID=UPI00367C6E1D